MSQYEQSIPPEHMWENVAILQESNNENMDFKKMIVMLKKVSERKINQDEQNEDKKIEAIIYNDAEKI